MNLPEFSPGIDLVESSRIARVLERGGEAFLRRTFTDAEVAYCQSHKDPVPRFAARFAAKEAVAKALLTGIGEAAAFREIEVVHRPGGSPGIQLHGLAAATAAAQNVVSIQLSLSHTDLHAAAMVIIQRGPVVTSVENRTPRPPGD